MTRAAPLVGMIASIALAGCAWEHPRGISPPREVSQQEQVEARQTADAKAKECILRQEIRRGQIEAGKSAKPFPKEKC